MIESFTLLMRRLEASLIFIHLKQAKTKNLIVRHADKNSLITLIFRPDPISCKTKLVNCLFVFQVLDHSSSKIVRFGGSGSTPWKQLDVRMPLFNLLTQILTSV